MDINYNFWYTLSATELSQDLWLSNPYCPAMRGGLVVFYPITSGLQRYPVELPSLFCFPDVRLVLVRQQIKHRAAKMSEFSTQKMQCYKVSKSNLYIAIVPLWKAAKPTPFKWINDNAHNSKETVNAVLLSSCSLQYFPLHGESAITSVQ